MGLTGLKRAKMHQKSSLGTQGPVLSIYESFCQQARSLRTVWTCLRSVSMSQFSRIVQTAVYSCLTPQNHLQMVFINPRGSHGFVIQWVCVVRLRFNAWGTRNDLNGSMFPINTQPQLHSNPLDSEIFSKLEL